MRPDRKPVKEAYALAGLTNHKTAWDVYYTYKRNGHKLRSPEEPTPQKLARVFKLDAIGDWLLSTLEEWRLETLEQRCRTIERLEGIQVTGQTLSNWY